MRLSKYSDSVYYIKRIKNDNHSKSPRVI